MSDSNFRKFLLDTVPADDDKETKGSKLLTEHHNLLCCFAYHQCLITISKRETVDFEKNCELRNTIFFKKLVYLLFPNKKWQKLLKSCQLNLRIF